MLLTATELRRIDYITWRTQNKATLEETAAHFELSVSAISNAERWYTANRLHNLEAYQRLKECRAEKLKHLRWLERKMKAIEKHYRGSRLAADDISLGAAKAKRPVPMSTVAQFSREWGRTHTEIAELDGLINRVLNVQIQGVSTLLDLLVQAHDELKPGSDRAAQALLN